MTNGDHDLTNLESWATPEMLEAVVRHADTLAVSPDDIARMALTRWIEEQDAQQERNLQEWLRRRTEISLDQQ